MSAPDVQGRLQALKTRFAARVKGELEELQRLLSPRQADAAGIQRAREAYEILHRIAGGAGTFGLRALGDEARDLEGRLQPLVEADIASPGLSDRLRQTLDDAFLARIHGLGDFLESASPLAAVDPREPYLPDDDDEPVATDIPQVSPTRVILADPDVAQASPLASRLQEHGYHVQWVQNPVEIQAIRAGLPEDVPVAVVADATLQAQLDDLELTGSPNILPVIYLAGSDSFELRYRLAESGAGGLFLRPVDIPSLVDRIEAALSEYQSARRSRVMLVDDDRARVMHAQAVLASAGMDVRVVVEPAEILAQLPAFRPDVLLLEHRVGPCSGPVLARMVRLQPEWRDMPVVFLTAGPGDIDQDALDTEDVLTGPLTDRSLIAAVRSRCYRARQLSRQLSRDRLSGTLVASRIRQAVAREHAQVRRHGRRSVVAILDLDDFRQLNRDYGHAAGDTVIRSLADVLRQRLRSSDLIGRYGGEEFVVLLPDCTDEQARGVFEAICRQFAGLAFQSGIRAFHATLSVGLAELGAFPSADAALAAADDALAERKQEDRESVGVWRADE
ncbi:diguanylate cyclase domain-containing protein [Marinobacter halodurans]|uniref:diguanylate cyclase domain-containing protein n=1 Tax=Marinobacter halodurans TaxID=2528979 RepID=UPI0013F14326|nr:diguanylate cyclase [Marinobacter halodurans]